MVKIVVAAIILAIYFLVLKPNQVRQECEKWARQEAVREITSDVEKNEQKRQLMQADYEELAINECLENSGMGK